MAIFLDRELEDPGPGHHRLRGHQAHPAHGRVRHAGRRAASTRARPAATSTASRSSRRCREAMKETGADVSVVFVPPAFAKDAVVEAIDAQIPLSVVITEGIPVHDTASFFQYAVNAGTTRIIGPNCPGLISPGKSNAGIIPADITQSRPDRSGQQVGHADLPDDVRAARHRLLHRGRHRRRPGHRHDAHRLPRGVRGRRRDRRDRDDRRDRRRRRGAGGGATSRTTSPSRSSATSPASPRPRARRWATPARSCPARPAPRRPRRKRSRPSASRSARPRPRPPA